MKKLFVLFLFVGFLVNGQSKVADSVPAQNVILDNVLFSAYGKGNLQDGFNFLNRKTDMTAGNGYYVQRYGDTIHADFLGNYPLKSLKSKSLKEILEGIEDEANRYSGVVGYGGVNINLAQQRFEIDSTIVFDGWEHSTSAQTYLKLNGNMARLVQNAKGQGGLVFKKGQPIYLQDLIVEMKDSTGVAVTFDALANGGYEGVSSMKSYINNLNIISNYDGYAMEVKNNFSMVAPYIFIESRKGSGLHLLNDSNTTNYGNSLFGFLRIFSGNGLEDIGLHIESVNNHPYNLTSFGNTQITAIANEGGGSNARGLVVENSSFLTFDFFKEEYAPNIIELYGARNIYFQNIYARADEGLDQRTPYNVIVGANSKDIKIHGQIFGQGEILADSTSTYSQGNEYHFKVGHEIADPMSKIYEANPNQNILSWDRDGSLMDYYRFKDMWTHSTANNGAKTQVVSATKLETDSLIVGGNHIDFNNLGSGTGNVSASSNFTADNKIIISKGTTKEIETSSVTINGNNVLVPGNINASYLNLSNDLGFVAGDPARREINGANKISTDSLYVGNLSTGGNVVADPSTGKLVIGAGGGALTAEQDERINNIGKKRVFVKQGNYTLTTDDFFPSGTPDRSKRGRIYHDSLNLVGTIADGTFGFGEELAFRGRGKSSYLRIAENDTTVFRDEYGNVGNQVSFNPWETVHIEAMYPDTLVVMRGTIGTHAYGPNLGPELIPSGDFSSGWSEQNGSTTAANLATVVGNGSTASTPANHSVYRNITALEDGAQYQLKFTAYTSSGSGNAYIGVKFAPSHTTTLTGAAQEYTYTVTAGPSNYDRIALGADSGTTIIVTQISLKKIL